MTFDSLLNIKMPETEIFDRFAEIVVRNFHKYQDVFIVLELGEADGEICFVSNVRFYKAGCPEETVRRREFLFGGEYQKANAICKFLNGFYHMTLYGHFTSQCSDILVTGVKEIRIIEKLPVSPENDCVNEKIDHNLHAIAALAFAEIAEELKKAS